MTEAPQKTETNRSTTPWRSGAWLVAIPFLLFVAIGWFAPNFTNQDSSQVRVDPLGGDYLQEYAGGVLIGDQSQDNQLYNLTLSRQIQHDEERLGFAWDESRFFPMVYPPFYYAAISPLSKLAYPTAMRVWLFLMVGFLIAGLLWLKRSLNVHNGILLVACLAAPLLLSLTTGQKSSVLFFVLVSTFCLLRSNKPFLAGAAFGLIAFKPHLGIPIGLFMLARRQWSFVTGCLLMVGCLVVASLATGMDNCADYFSLTLGFTDYVHNGGYHLEQGFSLWSAWQLALSDRTLAKFFTVTFSLIVIGGTAFLLRKPECHQGDNLLRSFSAMILATVLVSPHLYAYDLAMLLVPTILLSHLAIRRMESLWQLVPVIALGIVLFGTNLLIQFAAVSGINLGVLLMIVAWGSILGSTRLKTVTQEENSINKALALNS